MPDLKDGESIEMKGSAARPYILKNIGGAYSCNCPAWRNQSLPTDKRSCKHLRKLRGEEVETARVGSTSTIPTKTDIVERVPPPLLLAETWDGEQDVTGWWMSEKLDGVRAYWDGKDFISRLGNIYAAPSWFKEGIPNDVCFDGELWLDRKSFQKTISIVRRQDAGRAWEAIKYRVFDVPSLAEKDFEYRMKCLEFHFRQQAKKIPYALMHDQVKCLGLYDLRTQLTRVESMGGEGLMLRKPKSQYEVGRSQTLLKVKSFKDDEAIVTGYEPGKGKHKGRLGALYVKTTSGVAFKLGTGLSDAERENPPAIGSTVTFRYQELTNDRVPRFPSYLGVRDYE